ncbi:MAG: restriction endonuclease subunit S [Proteus mirabilis]|nr:restriction endonuclease subunit S [Proteus mirabilis]HEK2070584.1 restriction endonuclease subunit S [Proteus mirabilis]
MGSKVKLGELLSILTDYHANGAYKKLKENVELLDEPDFAVMIRTTNFEQEDFTNNLKYINKHAYSFLAKSKVYPNDIIMNKIANAGSSYLMPDLKVPVSLAMNLFLLRVDAAKANPIYIYLYLRVNEAYVKSFANGSVTKTITKDAVRNLEIELPSRSIQDRIAEQFICINNKITLNRQINQTLEQMAQTLFKSWFVDFDPVVDNALDAGFFEQDLGFSEELLHRVEVRKAVRKSDNFKPLSEDIRRLFPDAFEECAEATLGLGGWVPKRWRYAHFGDLLSSTIGGDWGKDIQDEKHTVQSRIVRGTDIPGLSNGQLSDAPLRWVEPKKLKSRQIEVGDIIIEVSGGSPTQSTGRSLFITQLMLERLGGVVEPASFCRRFKPKSYTLGMLASIHLKKIYSDGKMWEYQNQSTGIANFQTKFFLDAEQVLIPSNEVLDTFTKIVRPFIEKSQNNEQIELTHLRDTLLPKLISGELSLSDIKIDIPEETLI